MLAQLSSCTSGYLVPFPAGGAAVVAQGPWQWGLGAGLHPALPAAIVSPGCAPGGWVSWASPAEQGFISLMLTQKPGNKEKPLK